MLLRQRYVLRFATAAGQLDFSSKHRQYGTCIRTSCFSPTDITEKVQQFQKVGDTGEADSAPFMSILYAGWQWLLA